MKPIYSLLPVFLLACLSYGCADEPGVPDGVLNAKTPEIGIDTITDVKATSVRIIAEIRKQNGAAVTEHGFQFEKDGNLQTWPVYGRTTDENTGVITIDTVVGNLAKSTSYTFKAYAVNSIGSEVSAEKTVTTTNGLGSVRTIVLTDSIKAESVVCGGIILNQGDGDIEERGIYISTSKDFPDATGVTDKVTSTMQTDSFVVTAYNMKPNTEYFVRAYVKNEYGFFSLLNTETFKTTDGLPKIGGFDIPVSGVGVYEVSYVAQVDKEGDSSITARGVCWAKASVTNMPTVAANDTLINGTGTGNFSGTIGNLEHNTAYYVRAYATNKYGTRYSDPVSFTTRSDSPDVALYAPTFESGTVRVSGNVLSAGTGVEDIQGGVCWATGSNPTIAGSHQVLTYKTGAFTADLTGFRGGTTYYMKAFVNDTVNGKVSYSEEITFTTPDIFSLSASFPKDWLMPNSPAVFSMGDKACVLGGDKGTECTDELWLFNGTRWSQMGSFPNGKKRKWQTGVFINGNIYVFGGADSANALTDDFYAYYPGTNVWTEITTTPKPSALHSAVAVSSGSQAWFIGGYNTSATNSVWRFDTSTDSWSQRGTFPASQLKGIAVLINGTVYAGLGWNDVTGISSNRNLWTSSVNDMDNWTAETEAPATIGVVRGGVAYAGAIYVVNNAGVIWKYDPATGEWTKKSTLPGGNAGDNQHCMFVVNGGIYIGLGSSQNTLLEYDPAWDNE